MDDASMQEYRVDSNVVHRLIDSVIFRIEITYDLSIITSKNKNKKVQINGFLTSYTY